MMKPGPVSEGLAVIFWAASAVKVAGYSWQAYTGTREPFPAPGGGGLSAAAAVKAGANVAASAEPTIDKAFGVPLPPPLGKFQQWLTRQAGNVISKVIP